MTATFGQTLRTLRQARPPALGQTQKRCRSLTALAEQVGCDHAALVRMEQGTAMPRLGTLARICAALGASDAEIAALVMASVPEETE